MAPHPCRTESQASPLFNDLCWSTESVSNLKRIWADQSDHGRPEQTSRIEEPTVVAVPRINDIRTPSRGRYHLWRSPCLVDLRCLQGMSGIPHHISTTYLEESFVTVESDCSILNRRLPSYVLESIEGLLLESSSSNVSMESSEGDASSSMESDKSDDRLEVEVPIDSPYMSFTQRTRSRTYEVIAVGKLGYTCFYINFEDLQEKARKLAEQVKSVDGQAPRIHVDAYDLEIFLRFLCGSYKSGAKWNATGKFINILLAMAKRFQVPSVVSDCRKFVLESDWCTIDLIVLRKYFLAFENTGVDVFESKMAASRPVRSHIISGLVRVGRWPEFNRLLDRPFYGAAILPGLKRPTLSPAAVNLYLRKFFFVYGNEYHHSGSEADATNALQAIFPNIHVTSRVGL